MLSLSNIGLEDHLYIFGTAPQVPLSDMNGVGKFWIGQTWYNVYWCAASLILAVLAYGFVAARDGDAAAAAPGAAPRGDWPVRQGALLVLGIVVLAGSGAFIYYNTHILNEYRTGVGDDDYAANYEKALLAFEKVPQPKVTDVVLNVAIYPHQTRVVTNGVFTIQNRTGKPLSRIDVRWDHFLEMKSLIVDGAKSVKDYGAFHYVIYRFDHPMVPGATSHIEFSTVLEQQGFS